MLLSFLSVAIISLIWASGSLNAATNEVGGTVFALDDPLIRRYYAQQSMDFRPLEDEENVVPILTQANSFSEMIITYMSSSDNVFTPSGFKGIWQNERGIMGETDRDGVTIEGFLNRCKIDGYHNHTGACEDLPVTLAECAPPLSPLRLVFPGPLDVYCLKQCEQAVGICTLYQACALAASQVLALSKDCTIGSVPVEQCWTRSGLNTSLPDFDLFLAAWTCLDGCGTSYHDITEDMIDHLSTASINEKLEALTIDYVFFVDTEFQFSDEANPNLKSKYTRSIVSYGMPQCGLDEQGTRIYNNKDHDHITQRDLYLQWMSQYTDFFAKPDPDPHVTINYWQRLLSYQEVGDALANDFILAGLAGAAIFILIGAQTKSVFLSFAAFVNILISYPAALFFYHAVFQIYLDTALNRLAVFLILGIGADDIFVYTDTWKQAAHEGPDVMGSMARRVYWTWNKAAKAMAITSFTTFFAFIMTAISPLPIIETFGIFAALMVFINFWMIITWYPACVVVYTKYFESKRCCPKKEKKKKEGEHIDNYRPLERYLYLKYAPFVDRHKKIFMVVVALVFILGAIGSSQLAPEERSEQPWPKDSDAFVSLFDRMKEYRLSESSTNSGGYLMYGVDYDDPVDLTGIDRNAFETWGTVNVDPEFAANFDPPNQDRFAEICSIFRTVETDEGVPFVTAGQVECWIDDYLVYEEETFGDRSSDKILSERVWEWLHIMNQNGDTPNLHWLNRIGFNTIAPAEGETPQITYMSVYLAINVPYNPPLKEMHKLYPLWDDLMSTLNSESRPGMQKGYYTSTDFAFQRTQDVLIIATIESLVISYFVAVVCLVIASGNVVVGLLASLCILGIVFTIIGILTAAGLGLDIVNSIIYVMLVGLSVDYVVHIASAYNECMTHGRYHRASAAILEMGVSVISGAMTTICASLFLLGAQYEFFKILGRNLLTTIVVSIVWTICGFIPILMTFGPHDYATGDVQTLINKCMKKDNDDENGGKKYVKRGRSNIVVASLDKSHTYRDSDSDRDEGGRDTEMAYKV